MTKDAKTVLYHMYKEYLVRRGNQIPKSNAKCFGSSDTIKTLLFPDWCLDDLDETLRELNRNGYVHNLYASNAIYSCTLTDEALVVMENQKKETPSKCPRFCFQIYSVTTSQSSAIKSSVVGFQYLNC